MKSYKVTEAQAKVIIDRLNYYQTQHKEFFNISLLPIVGGKQPKDAPKMIKIVIG